MKDMEGKDRMMDEKAEIMVTGENPRETCTESGDEAEGNELYVRFRKPYVFEEDTYRGIDLSGLERLSANDIIEIEKRFYRLGITSVNPENTVAYAKVVASSSTSRNSSTGSPVK